MKYVNSQIKITIKCNSCNNIFSQQPNNHLSGHGCACTANGPSKQSKNWIRSREIVNGINIKSAFSGGEYRIILKKYDTFGRKQYLVDGFHKESNTVFEYHGDFWHGNPKVFRMNDINPLNKEAYNTLYSMTLDKERTIRNMGYNYECKWEYDWKLRKKLLRELTKEVTDA